MNLEDLPKGVRVFIDANIYIYHFTGASEQCTRLLARCENGEIYGISATTVYLEVLHRLMMVEALNKQLVQPPNIVGKLQKSPQIVRQLSDYAIAAGNIFDMGITIEAITPHILMKSRFYRSSYGLLVNDSIIAATADRENIRHLASNDDAFKSISEFTLYQPTDLDGKVAESR